MKGLIVRVALLSFVCTTLAVLAAAQGSSYGTVHGKCRDAQGNAVADAQVVWKNQENGRIYKLKTNKKGEFFSLGIEPGQYTVTLSKDNQVLDEQKNVHVSMEDLAYDIDLKQAHEQAVKDTAKQKGISQEQVKQQQAENEKAQAYNANIKAVNEKLAQAAALMKAEPPNYQQAIATYQEAANMAPDQDVVWYRLGNAYLNSAKTQTDPTERKQQYSNAYDNLKKAVDMRNAAMQPQAQTPGNPGQGQAPAAPKPAQPQDNNRLAVYYDNLGAAAAQTGKVDEASADYEKAAQLDPANAPHYYFNEGATLYNSASDEAGRKKAVEAFDKVIAADPTKADAYYLKGSALFAMVTPGTDGKMIAPAGTAEALQKYLELQPTGAHAEDVKNMLSALNAKVETSYGTQKKKK